MFNYSHFKFVCVLELVWERLTEEEEEGGEMRERTGWREEGEERSPSSLLCADVRLILLLTICLNLCGFYFLQHSYIMIEQLFLCVFRFSSGSKTWRN